MSSSIRVVISSIARKKSAGELFGAERSLVIDIKESSGSNTLVLKTLFVASVSCASPCNMLV
jgi:hypothetical protein